jgi:hypothetical protein
MAFRDAFGNFSMTVLDGQSFSLLWQATLYDERAGDHGQRRSPGSDPSRAHRQTVDRWAGDQQSAEMFEKLTFRAGSSPTGPHLHIRSDSEGGL